MKMPILIVKTMMGMVLLVASATSSALVIDNDLSLTQNNYFSVDVVTAGGTDRSALSSEVVVTSPVVIGAGVPQNIVYLYDLHVVIDGVSIKLIGSLPSLISEDKVSSNGSFTGSAGNTIEWTVESSIQNGSVEMRNVISFSSVTGTLGNIQVIQYLDQDVVDASDIFFSRGSFAQGNIELLTIDDLDKRNVGVSQSGSLRAEQGLINASFDGWAACVWAERVGLTDGSTTYLQAGVICNTLDVKIFNHPEMNTTKGAADIVTAMAWTLDVSASQSIIITTLGGVPDASVALAIDDYVDLIENTSTLESIVFDALANDVALDIPVTFLKTSDPTNGVISIINSVITYTPILGYFGQDSFTYSITDDSGDSDIASVFLNVQEDSNDNGIADSEELSALEIVKNYADDPFNNSGPTEIDYSNLSVSGVTSSNIAEVNAVIASLFLTDVDTVAKIQAIVDQVIVNLNLAAITELVEDLNGDLNTTVLTLVELKDIQNVTGIIDASMADYNAAFVAAPSPFADINNPTVSEVNAVITSVNNVVGIAALVDDLNGNANTIALTLEQLQGIQGVVETVDTNMVDYNAAFIASPSPFADINNPTLVEIQAVIDSVNVIVANETAALNELIEDIAGNGNGDLVDASELNSIRGVSGALEANQANYQAAFIATTPSPFFDSSNPTAAEIQAVIIAVNSGADTDNDNDGLADNDLPKTVLGKIKTGVHGAGNIHWAFVLILSLMVMFRQQSAVIIAISILSTSWSASAEWWDEMDVYVGAGLGQSHLAPSLGGSGYSIDDHTQNAWKLTAGLDLNDHISIEGYYSDLGRVKLDPSAKVGYRMMGGDAMLHYWAYGDERKKESIALYAKAGLNHMTNHGHDVSYEKNNTMQFFGGIGAELYLSRKFSVRFEIESYDTDAALLSLNLVKRFGFKSKK
jgi:hypothetical protein